MLNKLELGDVLFINKKGRTFNEIIYAITYIKEDKVLWYCYYPPYIT